MERNGPKRCISKFHAGRCLRSVGYRRLNVFYILCRVQLYLSIIETPQMSLISGTWDYIPDIFVHIDTIYQVLSVVSVVSCFFIDLHFYEIKLY